MAKRRPAGDGMIRKKDDGRWEGRIVAGHKANGKPIFRYVYAKTQKDLLDKLHKQKEIYRDIELNEDCRITLAAWLDRWLDDYMVNRVRKSTLNGYRIYADNYIKPHLGDKVISNITTTDVQKMYTKLKNEGRINPHPELGYSLSDSMIRSIHTMLHGAMKAAQQACLIAINPTEGAVIPRKNHKPKQVFNEAELDMFMNEIKKDKLWHDFFYTELTTGLRLGEICGLQWQDFDIASGILHIRRTIHIESGGKVYAGEPKTGNSVRKVHLPTSAAKLLKERKKSSISDWIFPNLMQPEEPLKPPTAYKKLKHILKNAGLPSLRFHDLRHTFCTNALAHGMDVKTLSTIIGHVSAATTLDIYAHSTTAMQQKAAQNIDKGIGKVSQNNENIAQQAIQKQEKPIFQPYKGKIRKPGTGCISQINDNLWEGRYSPKWADGKRKSRNIYAQTYEECEEKLAILISEMKAELAEIKSKSNFA